MTTYAPAAHERRPHLRAWLLAVGAVLGVLAAFGIGIFVGRATATEGPAQGLASEEVVAVIDGSLAALDRGDWDAFAGYWARDAVLEDAGLQTTARSREEIVDLNEGLYNLGARYFRTGAVIQLGSLAAYAVSCPDCPGAWSGIDLVELDDELKIAHLWTGNTAGPAPGE